jgi:hypothetical protein
MIGAQRIPSPISLIFFLILLISKTFFIEFIEAEWLAEQNPLFNHSLLATAGGAALANSLKGGVGTVDGNELGGIEDGQKRLKEDYK